MASMETSKGLNSIRPFFSSMSGESYTVQLLESWVNVAKKKCNNKLLQKGVFLPKMSRVKNSISETVL